MQTVTDCTTRLRTERRYDPKVWLERVEAFLELNYPELAAGDAFKARPLYADTNKLFRFYNPESEQMTFE
jgi:hypothetical protein